MSETKHAFPPNVVLYIRQQIERRTEYRKELEKVEVYNGYDDFTKCQVDGKRMRLQKAIDNLTVDILAITKKHFPSIEVDSNDEVSISNILAVLPAPEEVIVKKVYHGMQGPVSG